MEWRGALAGAGVLALLSTTAAQLRAVEMARAGRGGRRDGSAERRAGRENGTRRRGGARVQTQAQALSQYLPWPPRSTQHSHNSTTTSIV